MVDLKRKPEKDSAVVDAPREDFFPLSLHLGEQEISKLGVSGASLGDEMVLVATVRVTSLSANEREGGKKFEHMTLDLTEGEIKAPKKDQANILFGKKDD